VSGTKERCESCAAYGIDTPAVRHVDAAARIRAGFSWTEDEALSAGWTHDEAMCEECIGQLP